MSNTNHDRQQELHRYANEYAERLRNINLPSLHPAYASLSDAIKALLNERVLSGEDRDLISEMQSFDGHVAEHESVLVWLRIEDHTVVAWGGNCYDYDMTKIVEVKL
jgi:hypothetical protein